MSIPHSEKKLLKLFYKNKKSLYFLIGFSFLFICINVISNAVYSKNLIKSVVTEAIDKNNMTASVGTITNETKDNASDDSSESEGIKDFKTICSVSGIKLHGVLYTYLQSDSMFSNKDMTTSDDIRTAIQKANDDSQIKGILLEIDSPGGGPVAGEEVAKALKASKKPTVAVIRETGASASYWAASGAGKIIASENSNVGGIGITASYTENVNKDTRFVQLSIGKYKDAGNPDKPLSEEEKAIIIRDLKILQRNFIKNIAENRNLTIEEVTKIADGSTVLGQKAKELGLIDDIGGIAEGEDYLESKIGEKAVVCW